MSMFIVYQYQKDEWWALDSYMCLMVVFFMESVGVSIGLVTWWLYNVDYNVGKWVCSHHQSLKNCIPQIRTNIYKTLGLTFIKNQD